MSSCGNPAVEGDALMTKRPKYDRSKACAKCKLKTGNIVIRHAVYCKECFFPLISLRFRRALEPHVNPTPHMHRRKGLKASGNLLVGFSGGSGSTVLLDLVCKTYLTSRERSDEDQNPNGGCPWPKVFIVFVDVSGMLAEEIQTDEIRQVVKGFCSEFEYLPLKLEDAFDPKWWQEVGGSVSHQSHGFNIINEDIMLKALSDDTASPAVSLQKYIMSLPTPTATANAVRNLIRMLLIYTAASKRCSHLLLGTSLTSLSVSLISSISQGAGYSVKEEASEEWFPGKSSETDQTIRIIRPLRDIGTKECVFWAWWCGLRVANRQRYSGGRQDIHALTRDFIIGLERDYPSTVSTIARTCNKLTTKGTSNARCLMCERPVQAGIQDWKHKISIRSYSDVDTEIKPPGSAYRATNNGDTSFSNAITSKLCYACHTTWTSKSTRGGNVNTADIPMPLWTSELQASGEIWVAKKLDFEDIQNTLGDLLLNS